MIQVTPVGCETIVELLQRLGTNPTDCTEDPTNVRLVLTDDLFSDCRQAYGFYHEDTTLVGYAVINDLTESLDLLWVAPNYRRLGIATYALSYLQPAFTVCSQTNYPALSLYASLGIEVEDLS